MKKIEYVGMIALFAVSAVAAQKPSECQRPDAHMNPNCAGSPQPSATPAVSAIGGTYSVAGTNPEGKKYQGSVVITGDATNGFQFNWTVGEDQYQGTGTLAGDTLTVDWGAKEPAVYKVLDAGAKLQGKWGKRGRGRETLTRTSP